jgi:hypothetical protein
MQNQISSGYLVETIPDSYRDGTDRNYDKILQKNKLSKQNFAFAKSKV